MYVPKKFEAPSLDQIKSFIQKYDFATLISQGSSTLTATHIPLIFDDKKNVLLGHISIANNQKYDFGSGQEFLAIFTHAHSYVSSSWYDHVNVPTWNYIAVHVYGKIKVLSNEALLKHLHDLVNQFESGRENAFHIDQMEEKQLKRELRGIVGFEMSVDRIEASYKLSQNRDDQDHQNIIAELRAIGDQFSLTIADEMEKNRK